MIVELHIIQNFAPSNLNRDDTGSPKDCTFGGVRRARVSSQCLKRSVRTSPLFHDLTRGHTGVRTRHLAEQIADRLEAGGRPAEEARSVAATALTEAGFKMGDSDMTRVLLFVSPGEIDHYARLIDDGWDHITQAMRKAETKKGKKNAPELPKELLKALKAASSGGEAADIALFGRMVAENRNMQIDAACQVAHAVSTHAVSVEMDFFTAVDDLNPKEDTGAGMMGIVEFNSACFYRYAAVNVDQLRRNLHGEMMTVPRIVRAFVEASVHAIPSGKQNSMAANNLPSYVQVIVRDGGVPRSYANAFAQPVRRSNANGDLVAASVAALSRYEQQLDGMYGTEDVRFSKRAALYSDHSDGDLASMWPALEAALA